MHNIEYDYNNRILYQIKPSGEKMVLSDDFPSKPYKSPNGKYVSYISPFEWECLGSLYLIDLETGEKSTLIAPDKNSNIPKAIAWLDDYNLAVIIGFGYGTVAIGGNIFILSLTDNRLSKLTNYKMNVQVTNIKKDGPFLKFKGIKYTDEIYNKYEEFYNQFTIENII